MPPNTKKCEEQFKTYKERADYLSDINPQNTQIYRAIAHFFGEDLIPCGTKELNEKIMNDGIHTPQNEKSDQPKPEVPKCESGCLKHKYHCAKCNAIITYSPANYASRPNDIPNPCPNDCGRIAPASTEEWEGERFAWYEKLAPYSVKYRCDEDCKQGGCPSHIASFEIGHASDTFSITFNGVNHIFDAVQMGMILDFAEKASGRISSHDQQLRQRIVGEKLEIYGKYHCKKCNTAMQPKARLSWILKVGVRCVHVCPREDCGEIFIEKEH